MTTEVIDRGDVVTPPTDEAAAAAAKAAEDKAAQDAADLETATGKKVDEAKADDAKTEDEDKARDDKGRFIPTSRHKETLELERQKREVVERQLSELQKQLQQQAVSRTEVELNTQIADLRNQKAKATLDGDTDKIVALETQIDSLRDQIAIQKSTELSEKAKTEAREEIRMDAAIESLKTTYPVLDDASEDFDQDLVDLVLGAQRNFIENARMTPSAALVKAASMVMGKMDGKAQADEPAKGLAAGKDVAKDRKAAQVAKNVAAALAQPASMKDSGIDSDKAGMSGDPKPSQLTPAEMAALPAATRARLRGDFL